MRFVIGLAKFMVTVIRGTISIIFHILSKSLTQLLKIAAIYRLTLHPILSEILHSFTHRYDTKQRDKDKAPRNNGN
jgi:hypothetical protein